MLVTEEPSVKFSFVAIVVTKRAINRQERLL